MQDEVFSAGRNVLRNASMNPQSIGIVGYGRFGRTLAELCTEARLSFCAYDTAGEIPSIIRCDSLAEVAQRAIAIVLAVPVHTVPEVLTQLRPYLRADSHWVMDVGSVKLRPIEWMTAALGGDIPWVATHPLFGPNSLARGEPLKAVVCPNDLHPDAEAKAIALFESFGCEIVRQDPEEHDRAMAKSHAIAFFIAKGLLDAGADFDNRFTPPSFQSMRNTVDAVRADAGHLLLTLHRENPFAPAARLRFVQALQDLNATLSAYEAEPADSSPQPGEPTIPESPRHDSDLKQTRNHIDELDMELVALLARRAQLSRRAGRAKVGRPVRDPLRETELLKSRRQWADDAGLNPDNMEEIFQAVLRMSRQVQVDMR